MIRTLVRQKSKSKGSPQPESNGFEEIVLEQMPRLWLVALRFCRYHHSDAEDLLQDAMIRAFRYKDSLQQSENRFAWLRKTLLNTHLNQVRDNKHWDSREDISIAEEIPSFDPMPISGLMTEALRKDLWDDDVSKALDILPEAARTVLLLSDVEGLTRDEIAEMTGIAKGTVSSHIFRSRRKLAQLLENYAIINGHVTRGKLSAEQTGFARDMERAAQMGSM